MFSGNLKLYLPFYRNKRTPQAFCLNLWPICFEMSFQRLVHSAHRQISWPPLGGQNLMSKSLNFIIGNKHSVVSPEVTSLTLLIFEKGASKRPNRNNQFVILSSKHGVPRQKQLVQIIAYFTSTLLRDHRPVSVHSRSALCKLPISSQIILKRHILKG